MTRSNDLLRAVAIGGTFLLAAIVGSVVADAPVVTVPVGLILGALAMRLLILTGQAVPGGRTRRPREVGIGATIGVGIAALWGSALALVGPSAPKLLVVRGPALCAGFVLAVSPELIGRKRSQKPWVQRARPRHTK